jgi:hypothetical protein
LLIVSIKIMMLHTDRLLPTCPCSSCRKATGAQESP